MAVLLSHSIACDGVLLCVFLTAAIDYLLCACLSNNFLNHPIEPKQLFVVFNDCIRKFRRNEISSRDFLNHKKTFQFQPLGFRVITFIPSRDSSCNIESREIIFKARLERLIGKEFMERGRVISNGRTHFFELWS